MVTKTYAANIKNFTFDFHDNGTGSFEIHCSTAGIADEIRTIFAQKLKKISHLIQPAEPRDPIIRIDVRTADHLYMVHEVMQEIDPGAMDIDHISTIAAGMTLKGKGFGDPARIYIDPEKQGLMGSRVRHDDLTQEQRIILEIMKRREIATDILSIPWVKSQEKDGTSRLRF